MLCSALPSPSCFGSSLPSCLTQPRPSSNPLSGYRARVKPRKSVEAWDDSKREGRLCINKGPYFVEMS